MKLYHSPRSPFVRKVLVAIHELNLAGSVELVPTLVRMDTPHQALLALNPLGKIPTLVTDSGVVLHDSLVIIDHLDRQHGSRLIPRDGAARDQVLMAHALAHGLMETTVLWRNERDKPAERQTAGWLENFAQKTVATLGAMEAGAGDPGTGPFDLGAIATAVVLSYLDYRFAGLEWRKTAPRLARWHQGAEARASMQATAIVV